MVGRCRKGDKALIFAMGISFFTDTARFGDRRYYAGKTP